MNAHGPLAGNNSDVDVGEITLADMSPDDIRAELKRLYMQLEIFKNKTICRDNPHISKRRGGRKAQHRRFSLQVRFFFYIKLVNLYQIRSKSNQISPYPKRKRLNISSINSRTRKKFPSVTGFI